jgi:hypothetical protein
MMPVWIQAADANPTFSWAVILKNQDTSKKVQLTLAYSALALYTSAITRRIVYYVVSDSLYYRPFFTFLLSLISAARAKQANALSQHCPTIGKVGCSPFGAIVGVVIAKAEQQ